MSKEIILTEGQKLIQQYQNMFLFLSELESKKLLKGNMKKELERILKMVRDND